MMTDQQESDLALYAAQALENPALQEALKRMRESCEQAIRECPIRDAEGLQLYAQALRITVSVERVLRGVLESGKAADARIRIDNERSESKLRQLYNRYA